MFEEAFEYTQEFDSEIVAFQATNAAAIDGDKVHHALGFNLFSHELASTGKMRNPQSENATSCRTRSSLEMLGFRRGQYGISGICSAGG